MSDEDFQKMNIDLLGDHDIATALSGEVVQPIPHPIIGDVPVPPDHLVEAVGTIGHGGSSSSGGTAAVVTHQAPGRRSTPTMPVIREVDDVEASILNESIQLSEEAAQQQLSQNVGLYRLSQKVNNLCNILVSMLTPRMKYTTHTMLMNIIAMLTSMMPPTV